MVKVGYILRIQGEAINKLFNKSMADIDKKYSTIIYHDLVYHKCGPM